MYLKNFCNTNNRIWVYNDASNEIKELSIKDTTVIKHFYTIENNNDKDYTIENYLSKLESLCSPIISKLINKQPINQDEKKSLSVFIAVLQNRTPKAVKTVNQIMRPMLNMAKQNILNKEKERLIQKGRERKLNNDLMSHILDNFSFELTKNGEWGLLMNTALEMANLYSQMEWHLIYTENSSFITTDNPVLIYPATYDTGPYGNIGIALPTVEKHISLSSQASLRICDLGNPEIYYHYTNNKVTIREINKQLLMFREQYAIARDKEHLEDLIKRTKNKKIQTEIKVN